MEKIGALAESGFSITDLTKAKGHFEQEGYTCELIRLHNFAPADAEVDRAAVLIVRGGVEALIGDNVDSFNEEMLDLEWDRKKLWYGKVANSKARYNLCFADFEQDPAYEDGKGRIVSFENVPLLEEIRKSLPKYFGSKAKNLYAEGNYYYDISKCGIGWHGDAERKRVMGIRLGDNIPLHYRWYYKGSPIGEEVKLTFNHGDFYVMSEKASGFDWKKKNSYTLRHAAGADSFLKVKQKKEKN